MKYLLVVAHPDDEALGAGASMRKWSNNGDTVDVCIMCTEAKALAFRPADKELNDDMDTSTRFLGVSKKYEGTFPNIEMNTVPHLKLVQFIEQHREKIGREDMNFILSFLDNLAFVHARPLMDAVSGGAQQELWEAFEG